MNENENNFNSLRRILAFKNRETPPPGYFHNFSGNVLSRIRAGEASEPATASQTLLSEAPWLVKFLQMFELKPAYTGGFAMALCLVLVFGIVYAERSDYAAPQALLPTQVAENQTQPAAVSPESALTASAPNLLASTETNPADSLQPVATLFSQPNTFGEQVSFTLPGN